MVDEAAHDVYIVLLDGACRVIAVAEAEVEVVLFERVTCRVVAVAKAEVEIVLINGDPTMAPVGSSSSWKPKLRSSSSSRAETSLCKDGKMQ